MASRKADPVLSEAVRFGREVRAIQPAVGSDYPTLCVLRFTASSNTAAEALKAEAAPLLQLCRDKLGGPDCCFLQIGQCLGNG
jgi:hypothetical protein